MMRVVLAQPRGFCAGVERAIEIVERALEKYGPPIYVRHEIVHNRHVVERLHAKGAVFVDEIDEVPPGAVTIFSAHGVAREIEALPVIRPPDFHLISRSHLIFLPHADISDENAAATLPHINPAEGLVPLRRPDLIPERLPFNLDEVQARVVILKALSALPEPRGSLVRAAYTSAARHVDAREYDQAIADYQIDGQQVFWPQRD